MGMTTSEMRADVKELLKRVDEDAKGTRCLTMAEVTLCLDELRRLATPSVASPRAAWKDDALQSRINEAVDEANGVTAASVGEPGRTPPKFNLGDLVKLKKEPARGPISFSVGILEWIEAKKQWMYWPSPLSSWGFWEEELDAAAPPAQGAPTPETDLKEERRKWHEEVQRNFQFMGRNAEQLARIIHEHEARRAPGAREALDREQLAKAIWDGEIAESILKKAGPLGTTWAQWPEDSARQPYCQSTYRMADFIIKRLAQPGAPTKEGTCKEKLFS